MLMRCTQVAAAVDIAFFFLFHFLGSPILAWINIASVIMYSAAYYAIKHKRKSIALVLIWTEVTLHAGLGIILIGWDSGFHYYFLMFIPAICLSSNRKMAYMYLTILFCFYIGLDFFTYFIDPFQPIAPMALNTVHIFNLSTVFIMFSYLSFFYVDTVRRTQKKLQIMATTDSLTKLFNRRHMNDLAEKEMQKLNNDHYHLSIVLLDLDSFKAINDQHGHQVGDKVLIHVADILQQQLRETDLISRWGGEEFMVLLPDANARDAMLSAERIRASFHEYPWFEVLGVKISPTVSAGVTEVFAPESLSSAIARADGALYQCKADGRDKVAEAKAKPQVTIAASN